MKWIETNTQYGKVISSQGKDSFSVSGEINTKGENMVYALFHLYKVNGEPVSKLLSLYVSRDGAEKALEAEKEKRGQKGYTEKVFDSVADWEEHSKCECSWEQTFFCIEKIEIE